MKTEPGHVFLLQNQGGLPSAVLYHQGLASAGTARHPERLSVMALLIGAGLMALFDAVPALNLVLKVLSVGYLLWLAFKIATAAPVEERGADSRPMTFLQAATFQWVNPKAWAMCLSAITLYAPDRSLLSVVIVAGAFALVCFPAISVWAWLGTVVRQWLSNAARLRVFNLTMAALLVASLYPVLGLGS